MHRNIRIELPDPARFIEAMNRNELFQIDGEFICDFGYDTDPFADYEPKENYPKCCEYHSSLERNITDWFNKFPDCCDDHKILKAKSWFKKEEFDYVPNKIINQISLTENFIAQKMNEPNWYKEVTDYLSYNFESFGTPGVGSHLYFSYVQHWILNIKPIEFEYPNWKRSQLKDFLKKVSDNTERTNTDINNLKSTLDKWLKTFPSISYFERVKRQVKSKTPFGIVLYEPSFNRFSGLTKFKIKTEVELVEILINTTKSLLLSFNTPELLQKGIISDAKKHQLDLIGEAHSIKQTELLIEYNRTEIKYVKIIKKWLKNEKDYFDKITPLIQNLKPMPQSFAIEKRNTFDKDYLKVFVKDKSKIEQVASILSSLDSIRTANITENKERDITVYPANMYDISEVEQEVNANLKSYFETGELDPVFEEQISLLSNKGYSDILNHIYVFGRNLEKLKNLHDKFDEEGFREYFLPYLNAISKNHSATGETFNKIGKTDILIQDRSGLNVFIAECKLWKGEGELLKAIDQLFDRYVTWRDEKVALIIFNKDIKGFSELLTKATYKIKEHKQFNSYIGQRFDSSFSYTFKHSDDSKKIVQLELIIFNCK
ncbi:hypothetical protein [Pontibacter qinzhouensis]|nr:hypothetical protein [Pontibacter qinzhouensis]